jgi:hypothetical protein
VPKRGYGHSDRLLARSASRARRVAGHLRSGPGRDLRHDRALQNLPQATKWCEGKGETRPLVPSKNGGHPIEAEQPSDSLPLHPELYRAAVAHVAGSLSGPNDQSIPVTAAFGDKFCFPGRRSHLPSA